MKGSSTLQTYFKQNNKVDMSVKLIAELNMNRYYSNNLTSTTGGTNYWDLNFPAESVCMPNRPNSGMHYVRAYNYAYKNSAITWLSSSSWNDLTRSDIATYDSTNQLYTLKPRCYISNPATQYKYYSTTASKTASTSVILPITYDNFVWTNKIVVCFEISGGAPTSFNIDVSDGTSWTTIFTGNNSSLDATTGQINLYRSSGSWGITQGASSITDCTKIKGIRVSASGSFPPSIIEISPRIEVDITSRLVSWDMQTNVSEGDSITPIGTVSSNSGSLVLDNTDEALNISNINSTTCSIAEIARKWTEFKLSTYNFNGGSINETIRQFTLFGQQWEFSGEGTASVSLFDYATVLQETPNGPLILNNVTPTQALWRVLDSVGCPNIRISGPYDKSQEEIIDVFYTESKTNAWDTIKEVCSSLKYAVYINEYGNVVIANNNQFYNTSQTKTSSWTFLGQNGSGNVSDIISYSESISDEINYAKINYEPIASVSKSVDPSLPFSWSQVSDVGFGDRIVSPSQDAQLIGQSTLKSGVDASQTYCYINPDALRNTEWGHYKGYFLLDYEIIKYNGLEFAFSVNSSIQYVVVTSADEFKGLVLSKADPNTAIKFTGKLCNLERGQFGTRADSHIIGITSFGTSFGSGTIKRSKYVDPNTNNSFGLLGVLGKKTGLTGCYKDFGKTYTSYYSKILIKNAGDRAAGIAVATNSNNGIITDGIFIQINAVNKSKYPTFQSVPNSANTGNIAMWLRLGSKDGKKFFFRANKSSFNKLAAGSSHDITLYKSKSNTTGYVRIIARIDGLNIGSIDISQKSWAALGTGMALFSAGTSKAYFYYAGAASSGDDLTPGQNFKNVMNGFQYIIKDLISTVGNYNPNPKLSVLYKFDDLAREVVVSDSQFSKSPILDVKMIPIKNNNTRSAKQNGKDVYIATDNDIIGSMKSVSPFGATTILANVGSRPVLTSDDGMYPMLTGRIVERYSPIFVEYQDNDSVNRLGYKKVEPSPKWVTNKLQADKLANWIVGWQKNGVKTVEIESFANPLFSLLNCVDINFTRKNVSTSQKFIINDINQSWSADSGLKTIVKLVAVT